ncbi:MAG: cupredoxin domain-containing protein [Candidatus Blackburnbacteria bacterium]|nr:cupredoxin domain-containing protein [Candidatus Blackburnbacteria bacterium]
MNRTLWGVIAALLVLGGVYAFFKYNKASGLGMSSTPNPTPAESAMTTPAESTPSSTENGMGNLVTITASGFQPQTITVKAGDKVTWTNNRGADVSIDSDPHPIHTSYSPLNLGVISGDQSVSLVFDKPGTYGYHNHLSPLQKGTIVVE